MADFGVASTQLSEAQGQGTQPISPVEERVSPLGPSPLFKELGDIFVNGLKQNAKAKQEEIKNNVIGEYIRNENAFADAMASGKWNAARVSSESKANFAKFMAANPQYVTELTEARKAIYGGTVLSDVEKQEQAAFQLKEKEKSEAANLGYTFYSGMSKEAEEANLKAFRTSRQVEHQFEQDVKRANETRAQNSETRAAGQYQISVDDHVAKENAADGLRRVADTNFDQVVQTAQDLTAKVKSGMSFEEASAIHKSNIYRVRAALTAVAGKNPELAAPWSKLFDDMDANIMQRMDPKVKTAEEAQRLENEFKAMVTTAKIAAVEKNPSLLKAVVSNSLFPGDVIVSASNVPAVKEWLLSSTGADPKLQNPPKMVGTPNDTAAFKAVEEAVNRAYSIKDDKAMLEATNVINKALEETASLEGSLNPQVLKSASKFFSSTAFGRMAMEGKIDKQTAASAQRVFQVQYEPAVKQAIVQRLENANVSDNVTIDLVGGNVVFNKKTNDKRSLGEMVAGALDINASMAGHQLNTEAAALKESAAGLNQLIRLHAHLEGTTDYAKYWENNKHQLMPNIFPDPAKLKPGQVVDGYKYIGGNVRDRSNWIAEPRKPTGK